MLAKNRGLFLDRDGVINVDRGYVYRRQDFEFIDGIFELCVHAKGLGYKILIVTNQAGIARGLYSEKDFQEITDWMCDVFAARGAAIDRVYFCPYHPTAGLGRYRTDSTFRKPGPGMILQAAGEFDLALGASALVGDKESDIQAGLAAGVGCNLLYVPSQTADAAAKLGPVSFTTIHSLKEAEQFLSPNRDIDSVR